VAPTVDGQQDRVVTPPVDGLQPQDDLLAGHGLGEPAVGSAGQGPLDLPGVGNPAEDDDGRRLVAQQQVQLGVVARVLLTQPVEDDVGVAPSGPGVVDEPDPVVEPLGTAETPATSISCSSTIAVRTGDTPANLRHAPPTLSGETSAVCVRYP
jgi:hypothetical protein